MMRTGLVKCLGAFLVTAGCGVGIVYLQTAHVAAKTPSKGTVLQVPRVNEPVSFSPARNGEREKKLAAVEKAVPATTKCTKPCCQDR